MVSRVEDLYVLQSSRPIKAILPYNCKIAKRLLDRQGQGLPFPARDIIISLDPFFPQEKDKELIEEIPALMERGYTRFIVNNPGHFSLFRQTAGGKNSGAGNEPERAVLIAGPWLYTFNAWAWDFVARNGAEYCVSPLENNRQNLERTFPRPERDSLSRGPHTRGPHLRHLVFVTIFSRPSLFRIRRDLGASYKFNFFSGHRTEGRDETFRLVSDREGTMVYPSEPFSIVDKTPFLREAGFTRFILDFSSAPLKKAEYRDIMEAVKRAAPLSGVSRFNWKDGFFRDAKKEL
jgi:putative protease